MVYRVFVEKKKELAFEAKALLSSEDESVRAAGERILAVAAEIDKK